MPKSKDAFALRDFDFDNFISGKLLSCGLSETALKEIDADKDNFEDLQRARKSYQKLDEELKTFRRRLVRHNVRYQMYSRILTENVARLDDDDYYFSVIKPRSKRMMSLSDKYTAIAVRLLKIEERIGGIIYNLAQYQRGCYTKIFAGRLRQARKAKGLTQERLAKILGIKRNTYAAYETARNEPNVSLLALLSRELKCPTDWLLGLSP